MAKARNPFEYLDEADLLRVERWLSNPNPDVVSAVKILGIDEKTLLERLEANGATFGNTAARSFPAQVTYELRGTRKSPLNQILEPLYKYFAQQIDSNAIQLRTRRRRTYLFGSGTPEYLEAKITLLNEKLPSHVILEVERLIERAEREGIEVSVEKE